MRPLFFPGGNIGTLAVNGTVNDLAMSGAKPLYLSAGLILEEGLPMEHLQQVLQSMREAADQAGVQLVTGDTKVVDKGKADGIFINTAGIGRVEHSLTISPKRIQPGDAILINGDLGRHGIAVMAAPCSIALFRQFSMVSGVIRGRTPSWTTTKSASVAAFIPNSTESCRNLPPWITLHFSSLYCCRSSFVC